MDTKVFKADLTDEEYFKLRVNPIVSTMYINLSKQLEEIPNPKSAVNLMLSWLENSG